MKQQHIVLVTGGTGYIGQALISALADNSSIAEIRLVTRDRTRLISTIGISKNICICEGDIRDRTFLKRCTAGATIVYHLAAITPPIPASFSAKEIQFINTLSTIAFANVASEQGVRRFIHFSTTGLYGHTGETRLNEDSICMPPNAFERSKFQAETGLIELAAHTSMGIVILRPSNVIGEAQPRQRLLPLMRAVRSRRIVLTRPSGWQNLVYRRDVVDAALSLGLPELPKNSPVVYNVNCPIPNDALIIELATLLGVSSRFPRLPLELTRIAARLYKTFAYVLPPRLSTVAEKIDQLVDCRIFDPTRLRKELPHWPPFGMQTGLSRMVEYYRQQGWL